MAVPQSSHDRHAADDGSVLRAVNLAISELHRNRIVVLDSDGGESLAIRATEYLGADGVAELTRLAESPPCLLVTYPRAVALGVDDLASDKHSAVVTLNLEGCPAESVPALADPVSTTSGDRVSSGLDLRASQISIPGGLERLAIDLTKLAGLLPAAIACVVSEDQAHAMASGHDIHRVSADDIGLYRRCQALSLRKVSAANVPLAGAEDARIVVFRTADGLAEHLAIIIGDPSPDNPTLVRLHSQCITGDLLGSLRCDCGQQLNAAISALSQAGSGVLIYLAQEGRGIGLANKLRAYTLQDRGADTVGANHQLGFDADERLYLAAAEILRQLDLTQVRLLTNNPRKMGGLNACGISVIERVPLIIDSNDHNVGYLETKARRLGHLF